MGASTFEPRDLRRAVGWSLVGGLCVAAVCAIVALLSGSFDETDGRVVGMSLGFSVFTSTAGAGLALRLARGGWARVLGEATAAVSVIAFALLALSLWIADAGWRAFGIAALAALWGSHASLVLRAQRSSDTRAVRRLGATSIVTLGIDTTVGMAAIAELLPERAESGYVRLLAALFVLTLLCTALAPLLRRLAPDAPATTSAVDPSRSLADELSRLADRLDGMELPMAARLEVARLRALAREHARRSDEAVAPDPLRARSGQPDPG